MDKDLINIIYLCGIITGIDGVKQGIDEKAKIENTNTLLVEEIVKNCNYSIENRKKEIKAYPNGEEILNNMLGINKMEE